MDPSESPRHSFVVKVWIEETASETRQVIWRGYITDVPGGERHYFDNLDKMSGYIKSYLEELGVEFGPRRAIKSLLNHWKHSLFRRLKAF